MNLTTFFIALLLCMPVFSGLYAQVVDADSSRTLDTFTFTTSRLETFSESAKTLTFDSATRAQHIHQSLSELLNNESGIYIRSYGAGAISSASFRGTSAAHTAILWNGFNINSPMNGQTDLSLIPVVFFDDISLQYGGGGALWGSGAIGGAVHLNSRALFNTGFKAQVGASAGSFGDYRQNVVLQLSKKRYITSVKAFNSSAENNFSYRNNYLEGSPLLRQKHVTVKGKGLMWENHVMLKHNQRLALHLWYQKTNREVPPTMLQKNSAATQSDDNLRVSSEWRLVENNYTAFVRAAFFDDFQHYTDTALQIDAKNTFRTFLAEAETRINMGKAHSINIGLFNSHIKAVATDISDDAQRHLMGAFSSYAYQGKRLGINLSGRQEWSDLTRVPFTYTIGSHYKLYRGLALYAQAARVYRLPTLNDLYWEPGGNADLLSEDGHTQDIGIKWELQYKKLSLHTAPGFFNSRIDNWIVWFPASGYWVPQNIMHVRSRGVETNSGLSVDFDETRLCLQLLTNYVISSNQEARMPGDASVGKQLIYVPMYSGHTKLSVAHKKWYLSYRQNYVGYRYTSSDNTEYLPPYSLGSIYLSYSKELNSTKLAFYLKSDNIWNVSYEVVATRPMPLRHYNAGISITFY